MIDYQTLSIIIACIGVTASAIVGVASIVSKNRRDIKTREAQLYYQINSRTTGTKESLKDWHDVMIRQDWTSWDEYMENYSPRVNPEAAAKVAWLANFWQTLGVLARENLIDPKFSYRNYPKNAITAWNRLKPYVMGVRELYNNPQAFDAFEWLANKMKKIQESEQS
jgi:hypothetical protein